MSARTVIHQLKAGEFQEGRGATVYRTIGTQALSVLDPFLLLDEFHLDPASGAGFPDHPHRGFETVTYMLDGAMEHKDTAGHQGVITPGDIQWMTAGSGLVHSEMPKTLAGNNKVHGFQLWINLPAASKGTAPNYQDYTADKVPEIKVGSANIRLIAGTFDGATGPIEQPATDPFYADITLSDTPLTLELGARYSGHTAFLYGLDDVSLHGPDGKATAIAKQTLAVLSEGSSLTLSGKAGSRLIFLMGKAIKEPVARYGPFVMTTREEIMQTVGDWNRGTFPGHPSNSARLT